jgi:hypothetical protein
MRFPKGALRIPAWMILFICGSGFAERESTGFVLELPLNVSHGDGDWSAGTGAKARLLFPDLGLDRQKWPRLSRLDLFLMPSAGVLIAPGQVTLEVSPIFFFPVSPLYRKDLLGSRDDYVGAQFHSLFLFSWVILHDYSVSRERIVRTLEPYYALSWNLDERYRLHEFGVTIGFWFPGVPAHK